jgi:hypothetical protein
MTTRWLRGALIAAVVALGSWSVNEAVAKEGHDQATPTTVQVEHRSEVKPGQQLFSPVQRGEVRPVESVGSSSTLACSSSTCNSSCQAKGYSGGYCFGLYPMVCKCV